MRHFILWVSLFVLIFPSGCRQSEQNDRSTPPLPKKDDAIHHYSLNAAIHQGQYGGFIDVGNLIDSNAIGLGSFDKLSHEFVMIDGQPYGIPASGKAELMNDSSKIAYAVTKAFVADTSFTVHQTMSKSELLRLLDMSLAPNSFAALRISGLTPSITYRSFHPQSKPFKAIKHLDQVVFYEEEILADIVGFYTPRQADALNSPVYHFHFVDQKKTTGGHVLDFSVNNVTIQIDYSKRLMIELPPESLLNHINLNQ